MLCFYLRSWNGETNMLSNIKLKNLKKFEKNSKKNLVKSVVQSELVDSPSELDIVPQNLSQSEIL